MNDAAVFVTPEIAIAIIRGPCFYMLIKLRIFAWIPDIFPEIQEKFREDGAFVMASAARKNRVTPEIAPVIPEIAQQLSGIHAKYILKFNLNYFTGSRIFFLRIQKKFREDGAFVMASAARKNRVTPEIAPVIPEIAQQLSGIHAKYILKFNLNYFTGSRIFFLKYRKNSGKTVLSSWQAQHEKTASPRKSHLSFRKMRSNYPEWLCCMSE